MLIFEIHRSAKLWLSNNIRSEVGAGGTKGKVPKGKCTRLNCILATRSHPLGLVGRRPALVYWWWWWRCWWWHWWRWWTWWQAGWMNQCLFLHTRPDNIGNWWQYFLWWWYKVISYKRTIVVVVVGSPSNTTLRIFPKLEALLMDRSKPVQPQRSQESNQCNVVVVDNICVGDVCWRLLVISIRWLLSGRQQFAIWCPEKPKIFFWALPTSHPVPLCMRSPKHPLLDFRLLIWAMAP